MLRLAIFILLAGACPGAGCRMVWCSVPSSPASSSPAFLFHAPAADPPTSHHLPSAHPLQAWRAFVLWRSRGTHTHAYTHTHARTNTHAAYRRRGVRGVPRRSHDTHTRTHTHTRARTHAHAHTHTHTPPPAGVACVMCYGAAVGGGSMPMPSDVPLRALYASTLASVCMWAVLTPLLFKWVQLGLGLGLGLGHTRPGQRVYVGRPYAAAVQVGQARVRGRGRVRARAHPPWPACACGPSSRRCCSSGSSVGGWAQRGRRVRVGLGGVGVCEWAQAGLARAGGLGWGRRVRLGSGGASMLHMGPLPTLLLP